jgi:very-short-patch-repair endonuclease
MFEIILQSFAVDYACQVTFYDTYLDHYGVGAFRVDFVIYNKSVIFEIDGISHRRWQERRIDRMKDEFLTDQGFEVVRITNKEIDESFDAVASRVYRLVYDEKAQLQHVRRSAPRRR